MPLCSYSLQSWKHHSLKQWSSCLDLCSFLFYGCDNSNNLKKLGFFAPTWSVHETYETPLGLGQKDASYMPVPTKTEIIIFKAPKWSYEWQGLRMLTHKISLFHQSWQNFNTKASTTWDIQWQVIDICLEHQGPTLRESVPSGKLT